MDLLLYLVRKEEIDIYDIPITRITEQYVKYIEMLGSFDIDVAAEFLILAATLMQIKSAMLLPAAESEDEESGDPLDPRSELIRQLLEYKKFKDAANKLAEAAHSRNERFSRPSTVIDIIKGNHEPELDLEQVSTWDLLEAFDRILKETSGHHFDMSHIVDETPIDLYQIEILHKLQSQGPTRFGRIFQDASNRLVMVGMFLAVLELARNKLIWIDQESGSNHIFLKSTTDQEPQVAVENAIMANMEEFTDSDEELEQDADDLADIADQIPEMAEKSEKIDVSIVSIESKMLQKGNMARKLVEDKKT
jgi:segregation and condensation protein A